MEKTEKRGIFYGWWIVVGAVIVSATMVPSVMAMANKFLIPVSEDLNISRSAFALSNAILQGMGIFLSPYITRSLSNKNLKKMQTFSILVFGLAFMSYGLAKNVTHLYISSFILGVSYLMSTIIPISIMITNWFNKSRGLAMSIALSGIGLGGFIFSPLITSWITNYGWRKTYFIYGAIMLLFSLPISLFVFKKTPEEKGLKAYGFKEANEDGKKEEKSVEIDLRIETKDSFSKPFFMALVFGMVLNGIINTGSLGQFPPALEGLHGAVRAAKIISLYSLMGIAGKIVLGWINDRFGVISGLVFGTSAFGLAFVLMLFSQNIVLAYMMAFVFGFGNAIGTVVPPLLTSSIYGSKKYGEVYGYISSASQLGLTFGSLIVASIYDLTGEYKIAWIVMTGVTVLTLISWIYAYKSSLKYRENN